MNLNTNRVSISDLNQVATEAMDVVDSKDVNLASNFADIAGDCRGLEGFDLKTELQNRYPLVTWLLNTSFARQLRQDRYWTPFNLSKNDEGKWVMKLPGSMWTLPPENDAEECCWTIPGFDKCAGEVPLNLLCLKDCDSVFDHLVYDAMRISSREAISPFARAGESMRTVERRLAKYWMAFYTAHTIIQGMDGRATNILKPFHGLMQVLENPAVLHITGENILVAFEQIACRLPFLGSGNRVFATNPLIMRALEAVIVPDQYGNLPSGWAKRNGNIVFNGGGTSIGFIEDKLVPVNMDERTGEIWLLDGEAVGAVMATTLAPTDAFTRYSGIDTSVDNCGAECDYYYNFGTVANRNSNALTVITDVPINGTCGNVIGDLLGLVNPETLVPYIGA